MLTLCFVDHPPQPAAVGVRRHALEDELGRAVEQAAVDDVRVAGDPAAVGGAEESVTVLQVEDIFDVVAAPTM